MNVQLTRLAASLKFSSKEEREIIVAALLEKGQPAIKPLLEILPSGDVEAREAAAYTIRAICGRGGVLPRTAHAKQLISRAIRDRRQNVRLAIIHVLGTTAPDTYFMEALVHCGVNKRVLSLVIDLVLSYLHILVGGRYAWPQA